MESRSLSTKYRPSRFDMVCGQNLTTNILEKSIEAGTFSHAILLSGPSGCGKTTLARIFANRINGNTDFREQAFIELDAASNNGVEQVRDIIKMANQRDLLYKYKVFIIDECHVITSAGWQAFLKGIEEAPEYTVYIFCTTDPDKLPDTILNRLQQYQLLAISQKEIFERLVCICNYEKVNNVERDIACDYLSKLAGGSMRQAITYLDKCLQFSKELTLENCKAVLNLVDDEVFLDITKNIFAGDYKDILSIIDNLDHKGTHWSAFIKNYLSFVMDLVRFKLFGSFALTDIPLYLQESISKHSLDLSALNRLVDFLLEIKTKLKSETFIKNTLAAYLLQISKAFKEGV